MNLVHRPATIFLTTCPAAKMLYPLRLTLIVTPFHQLPFWMRAVYVNAVAIIGVFFGFAWSGADLPPQAAVPIAVYTVAFLNFMLLIVAPRVYSVRNATGKAPSPWSIAYEFIAQRPFIMALVILQIWGGSRAAASSIQFLHSLVSDEIRSVANAHSVILRMKFSSAMLVVVAIVWLMSAIGLWLGRRWAWWLALVLNALAMTVSAVLQLLARDQFLFDPFATIAVALLLLPTVRTEFRIGHAKRDQAPTAS